MDPQITPLTITIATLIAQFAIIAIISGSALIIKPFYDRFNDFALIILVLTLLTFGSLFFSDEFLKSSQSILRNPNISIMSWKTSIFITFILNIIFITIMVFKTGGSKNSIFAPLYFLLPTLALLLREPLSHLIVYAIMICISFTALLSPFRRAVDPESTRQKVAYWVVSISSFILTLFIGYKSRSF
ncbi:MAG: hypothetical protein P4L51_22695 [Puia sp.]|nr:hypothetical protein [Puia sp.]